MKNSATASDIKKNIVSFPLSLCLDLTAKQANKACPLDA